MTTKFEKIKNMNIDELSEFLSLNESFQNALGIGLRAAINEHWNGKPYMSAEKQNEIQIQGLKQWLLGEEE